MHVLLSIGYMDKLAPIKLRGTQRRPIIIAVKVGHMGSYNTRGVLERLGALFVQQCQQTPPKKKYISTDLHEFEKKNRGTENPEFRYNPENFDPCKNLRLSSNE